MKKIIYLFLLPIIVATGCTEDITSTISSELETSYQRLIVDGSISTDTMAHRVHLALSSGYFYNKPLESVTKADVSISDGTNVFKLTEDPLNPGDYLTQPNVYGVPGRTYTLTIKNVDVDKNGQTEEYTASSKLYPISKIDSIAVKVVKKFYKYRYEVRIWTQDPADITNYYAFKVKRNNILLTDTLSEVTFTNDEFFNGSYVTDQNVYHIIPTKTDERLKLNDVITLESCGITKDYATYLSDIELASHGADPFGGQPANVSTNLSDKKRAIGFFVAYSITRNVTTVKDTVPTVD